PRAPAGGAGVRPGWFSPFPFRLLLAGPPARPGGRPLRAAIAGRTRRYSLFLRRHHHDHLPPFELRHLLDHADVVQVLPDPGQQLRTDVLVSHLPASDAPGVLRLVHDLHTCTDHHQLTSVYVLGLFTPTPHSL